MHVENMHVETRERVSDGVVCARNVLCRYCKIMRGSCEEQAAEEGHDVWAVGGAGPHTPHHSLVVTQEADAEGGPAVAPGNGRHDGIQICEVAPVSAVLECPGDRLNLTALVLLVTDTCCPAVSLNMHGTSMASLL